MLFSATSAQNIFDTIGGVTLGIMNGALPYLWTALGIYLAFKLANMIISLFKHGVSSKNASVSGSDTDQLRAAGSDSETQAEINKQFPLM